MLNDRAASELISKSLRGNLTDLESRELDEHLQKSTECNEFAQLSAAIDQSISEIASRAESGDGTPLHGLSTEAKSRMQASLLNELSSDPTDRTVAMDGRSSTTDERDTVAMDAETFRSARSRFKLLRKIGEGGLGTVWLARDERIKRIVALKEMNIQALQSPKAWNRFLREAQITAHLEHPSVVPMYLFGEDKSLGQPFYAMRFVGKQTLADAIEEYHEKRKSGESTEMELHRLLTAFQRICQAMAYVHKRGVIHRDLKPENIALSNFGEVVILDWGLAKFVDDGELSSLLELNETPEDFDTAHTLDGEIVGTPLYMSPEQAAGRLEEVDERTDVYGLGAILFAILTGSAPHADSCRTSSGHIKTRELLDAIVNKDTPSPRNRAQATPRDLDTICRRAMAKRRAARFGAANDLAEAIERWLAGQRQKPNEYETIRMEGRELRANLESAIEDLTKNVRFMANLPPIQGLVQTAESEDKAEIGAWRERLSTIFQGLLRTNSDYSSVTFCQVAEDSTREIVRVERHSTDASNIRTVPISRLDQYETGDFLQGVMAEKPEEVHVSHESSGPCDPNRHSRLSAGVPVFDDTTEEPFGCVVIECQFLEVIDRQIRQRVRLAKQILLLDESNQVRLRHTRTQYASACEIDLLGRLVPNLDDVLFNVAMHGEYRDVYDYEVYAAKVAFPGGDEALTLLLLASDDEGPGTPHD